MRNLPRHAFTLVELLVVVAIIIILASLFLPALRDAQVKAQRAVDCHNIQQFAKICFAAAGDNSGNWPNGNVGSPYSGCYDDMVHFPAATYDTLKTSYGLGLEQSQCYCFRAASISRWSCGGADKVQLGWLYYGNRNRNATRYVCNADGTSSSTVYQMPYRITSIATSPTLLLCLAWTSPPGMSWNGTLPHGQSEDMVSTGAGVGPFGLGGLWSGVNVAYTDGSARWVQQNKMWAQRDVDWMYYDPGK